MMKVVEILIKMMMMMKVPCTLLLHGKEKKRTRGKTNCKKMHSADFKDFEKVEFYKGQPVGPTPKVVSNLRAFIGTVVRNPQWVTLLYTSWHGVPEKAKEDMWDYINQKFILLIESKKWVMQALCRAWKKHKGDVKQNHFMKYKTRKQMLKNRPEDIPEVQFRKLIRYWSLPEIRALSEKNIENRSKQTCPYRTGSTGFGIVCKQLREFKENNEEPSRAEIFTVTRTSRKGKEIDPKSQSTIDELNNRIEVGQNHEEAFVQVLRKDQPGRLRCYGASVTKSSLKRHEEIAKSEGNMMSSSLERQMEGVCGLLTVMLQQMNLGKTKEDIAALVQVSEILHQMPQVDQEILPIPLNLLIFHPTRELTNGQHMELLK
ncbi:hypothetical protein PIB30_072918 [Stylosanthes scabra]|uniref:Transposase n=1 Tax=Stylosanthes scabra TaxID=79078 RepID=A0ABU6URH1_9FABA|nr:hypothetical protein [Stylosanthes scabra]